MLIWNNGKYIATSINPTSTPSPMMSTGFSTNPDVQPNRLNSVAGTINGTSATQNYTYDDIGNLIANSGESIDNVDWSIQGKVTKVDFSPASGRPDVTYKYDASGNRLSKNDGTTTTYYLRTPDGNVLSVYKKTATTTMQVEAPIYGSSRLGQRNLSRKLNWTVPQYQSRERGQKAYELANHLGNVLATISDQKHGEPTVGNDWLADHYMTDLRSAQNYYPFGLTIPNTNNLNADTYRYGFNGKENDKDWGGDLIQDYGFRMYNPRIGKFLSVDPLASEYAYYSPYHFAGNTPVMATDIDGLEPKQRVGMGNIYPKSELVPNHVEGLYKGTGWYFQRVKGVEGTKDYWTASRIVNQFYDREFLYYEPEVGAWKPFTPEGYVRQDEGVKAVTSATGEFGLKAENFIIQSTLTLSTMGGAVGYTTARGLVWQFSKRALVIDAAAQTTMNLIDGKNPITNYNVISGVTAALSPIKNPALSNAVGAYLGNQFNLNLAELDEGIQVSNTSGALAGAAVAGSFGRVAGAASDILDFNFKFDIGEVKPIVNPIATAAGAGLEYTAELFESVAQKTGEQIEEKEPRP